MKEEKIDLLSWSIRDNLLFVFNFDEECSSELRKAVNCVSEILDFCDTKLNSDKFKITHAILTENTASANSKLTKGDQL